MKKRNAAVSVALILLKVAIYILIIVVLISFGKKSYAFGYKVFAEETVSGPPGKKVVVTIEEGISPTELGKLLKEKGLIKDPRVFWVQVQLSKYKDKIQAGNYILNTSETSEEMLAILSNDVETESEISE